MSDIKLFRIGQGCVSELPVSATTLEKALQTLIERHLDDFLGVRFLASEYSTGRVHGGRIDTLGIDENGLPVIIEYKRATHENVINQGLFYLDWLMDHRGDFEMLVQKELGAEAAKNVEWSAPRLICIAGDFTKYDEHAVKQINRNIELVRYRRYGDELLLFELVNAQTSATQAAAGARTGGTGQAGQVYKTVSDYRDQADPALSELYESLRTFLESLGDDIQIKTLQYYIAFKRIKNFACVEFRVADPKRLLVYVKVDPGEVDFEAYPGLLRDVRKIGHFGTGDLEITIRNPEDLEMAKPLLERSYLGA